MATKPTTPVITWATSPNYSDGPDLGTPTKVSMPNTTDGHIGGAGFAPTAQEENWLRNNQQEWADYFEQATDENAALLTNAAASYRVSGTVSSGTLPENSYDLAEEFQTGGFVVSANVGQGDLVRVPVAGIYRISCTLDSDVFEPSGLTKAVFRLRAIGGGSDTFSVTYSDEKYNSGGGSANSSSGFTALMNVTDPDDFILRITTPNVTAFEVFSSNSFLNIDLVSRTVA